MEAHYNQTWVKLMPTMRQAHPSGTKSRYYPDAPQDKPYTMDFTPGFDISKSRYALREPSNYSIGVNPFAARDKHLELQNKYPPDYLAGISDLFGDNIPPPEDMYANSALQEVNNKLYHNNKQQHRKVTIRNERENLYKTKFQRMVNHDSNGESSGSVYYTQSPIEADEAQKHLLRHKDFIYDTPHRIKGVKGPDYYYSEPKPNKKNRKDVYRTVAQMQEFLGQKGIDLNGVTQRVLKKQIHDEGLSSEYEESIRQKQARVGKKKRRGY
jgi:hypothetical protein